MYHLEEKAGRRPCRLGFTIIELLVLVVALAVLAAILIPKFTDSDRHSKEAMLKNDLRILRNAICLFQADTGLNPLKLEDLCATTAPAKGSNGAKDTALPASHWHGPYVAEIPNDPISESAFTYTKSTGKVRSSATGEALDGTAYNTW